ncbi:Hypothetical predicted protein [Pelobates cultripes]|uniref:Uncharacterized protein n=1 Tax=Pelobates cultripes TaxID=61616 RepID=A0AAD1VJL9_PELCU|nr:Hypothetical predicted protein [Pelobates cultripes]
MAGLSQREREGSRQLLQLLATPDLQSLAGTVTKNRNQAFSRTGAIEAIILYSSNTTELLKRRKVLRDIIYQYLVQQRVSVASSSTKTELIQHAVQYWATPIFATSTNSRKITEKALGYLANPLYQGITERGKPTPTLDSYRNLAFPTSTHFIPRKTTEKTLGYLDNPLYQEITVRGKSPLIFDSYTNTDINCQTDPISRSIPSYIVNSRPKTLSKDEHAQINTGQQGTLKLGCYSPSDLKDNTYHTDPTNKSSLHKVVHSICNPWPKNDVRKQRGWQPPSDAKDTDYYTDTFFRRNTNNAEDSIHIFPSKMMHAKDDTFGKIPLKDNNYSTDTFFRQTPNNAEDSIHTFPSTMMYAKDDTLGKIPLKKETHPTYAFERDTLCNDVTFRKGALKNESHTPEDTKEQRDLCKETHLTYAFERDTSCNDVTFRKGALKNESHTPEDTKEQRDLCDENNYPSEYVSRKTSFNVVGSSRNQSVDAAFSKPTLDIQETKSTTGENVEIVLKHDLSLNARKNTLFKSEIAIDAAFSKLTLDILEANSVPGENLEILALNHDLSTNASKNTLFKSEIAIDTAFSKLTLDILEANSVPGENVEILALNHDLSTNASKINKEPQPHDELFDTKIFGEEFCKWFYQLLNSHNPQSGTAKGDWGPCHFWDNAILKLIYCTTEKTEEHKGAQMTSQCLLSLVQEKKLMFSPNLDDSGLKCVKSLHGLVVVAIAGIVIRDNSCLDLFQHIFGLVLCPISNNWKIQFVKMKFCGKTSTLDYSMCKPAVEYKTKELITVAELFDLGRKSLGHSVIWQE